MSKQRTTQDFIEIVRQVHGDKYDYTKSIYTKKDNKLIITCSAHGDFLQGANNHMRGHGCPKCAIKPSPFTLEQFIEKAVKVHGNFYSYENFVYTNANGKSIINCPLHGNFTQSAGSHCRGCGCPICGYTKISISKSTNTTEDFILRAKKVHGDKYDYTSTIYTGSSSKLTINCPLHGEFLQTYSNHLNGKGCRKCGIESGSKVKITASKQSFEERARKVHGSRYDYSNTNYIAHNVKVEIICKSHGSFFQSVSNHLAGYNCEKCGREVTAKAQSDNPMGWKCSDWQKSAKSSQEFESFKVYLLNLYNESENFYKIGRTFTKTKRRVRQMPYEVVVLHEITNKDPRVIFDLENHLKREYKNLKYIPKIPFRGMQECFSLDLPISTIIDNYPTNYIPKIDDSLTPTP
jgi:hypothetical protein